MKYVRLLSGKSMLGVPKVCSYLFLFGCCGGAVILIDYPKGGGGKELFTKMHGAL